MTIREAREQALDLFFFGTREQREAFVVPGVQFEEEVGHTLILCLAVAPRTNTTTRGQREFFGG